MTDSTIFMNGPMPLIENPSDWVVWLDLDDTLWDFRGNSHESLIELYDHLDLGRFWKTPDDWIDHYHRVNSALWDLYAKGVIKRDVLRHDRFFTPFTEAGMDQDEAEKLVPEADRYYLERLGLRGKLVPGAGALINRLKERGFRLGILSNGFKEVQYNKLRSSGLDNPVDIVVLSDEIDVNKPDPRLFRHAEKRAGIDPSHCILIGDNPETDIAGALRSGWQAIWFNPEHKPVTESVKEFAEKGSAPVIVSSLDSIRI